MSQPEHHHHTQSEEVAESEDARMIRLIRELRLGGNPRLHTQIVMLIEVTTRWTQDMIEQCLIHQPRAFYYNMKYNTIADARLVTDRLNAAQAAVRQRLGLPPTTATVPLLLGFNRREYHLGLFCRGRLELHLHAGRRFILTADRRLGRRGCRRAVYCNMHQALEIEHAVVNGSTIIIGAEAAQQVAELATADFGAIFAPSSSKNVRQDDSNDATVVLNVCYVHGLSIVCTVLKPGTIYPCSPVQLPAVAYDSTISRESRDNIDFALEYGALAIVVPVPKNDVYHHSMVSYVKLRQEQLPPGAHRSLYLMTHLDRCGNRAQRQFICEAYDGVIYRPSLQRQRCLPHLAIEPTGAELAMRNQLRAAHKPLFLMEQTAYGSPEDLQMPRLAETLADMVHYYADGIMLMSPQSMAPSIALGDGDDGGETTAAEAIIGEALEANITAALYRYTYMLRCMRPKEVACSMRLLDKTPLAVDRTRTGHVQMARNAVLAAFAVRAGAILVATSSGRTACNLAAWRPCCPVIAVVDGRFGRMLALCRGVHRVCWQPPQGDEDDRAGVGATAEAVKARWQRSQYRKHLCGIFSAIQYGMIASTDRVVIVCRSSRMATSTDTFHVCEVAEFVRRFEMLYV